ncbi:c-type cytochrome [Celeribacter indicus]|uniref:Gluconate 2-dehydrogenase (Acceptor) n=1 Tax=Celeribacter indicus TaxID=1208324 RepID=A0A0B5E161_9RHOB|nr:cytochrome c [Celeribacter indicus]AJE47140.1 gluconate 2-dehydrogenase (acceptor) [Celeribacter indicus]SDW89884.1 Cytochrome c, mono-and diheme variants [Celeribacter indicus]
MKTFLRTLAALVIVGLVALAAFIFWPVSRSAPQQVASGGPEPKDHGEYAMRLADCAACHTAEGGAPFAGGRPIESPVGTLHSANITPDPETGIGGWTLAEFRGALVDGLDDEGHHLYPAMPYTNYRGLTETDIAGLYHYFIEELDPVRNEVAANDLPFPFDQRWGLRAWKWVAMPEVGFASGATSDDPLRRGAYLVEGPGHCGACHSPRNMLFVQEGYTADDPGFLAGGVVAGWTAPALRGEDSAIAGWTAEEVAQILGTGRNAHAAINGEMLLVVEDSTQYFTEDDLIAVSRYLVSLDGNGGATAQDPPSGGLAERLADAPATETERMLASADPNMPEGARLYLDNCGACHFVDGKGADEVFPELDGSSIVQAGEPTGLISMILEGGALPSTEKRPYALRMPGFADRLSDAEVATLASFLRSAWSNDASGSVDAGTVADLRSGEDS